MNLVVAGRSLIDYVFLFFYRREADMSYQPRVARVLVVLLVSMTTGAIVLMALGNHPPSAGPGNTAH